MYRKSNRSNVRRELNLIKVLAVFDGYIPDSYAVRHRRALKAWRTASVRRVQGFLRSRAV